MRKAILNYYNKLKEYPQYYCNESFDEISKDIKDKFKQGIVPIERKDNTNVSLFETEFGSKLPDEIEKYINIFWHPCISGYLFDSECIILFSVLKKEGDSVDNILYYKNNLITMSNDWRDIGDIHSYIPIGWLGYSGTYVLYEIRSGRIFLEDRHSDVDGKIEQEPIAHSMCELINRLEIRI